MPIADQGGIASVSVQNYCESIGRAICKGERVVVLGRDLKGRCKAPKVEEGDGCVCRKEEEGRERWGWEQEEEES